MIKKLAVLILILVIFGCGGGGSGTVATPATVIGRVLNVQTGTAPSPGVSVQVGSNSITTQSDGTFSIAAPAGATTLKIDAGSLGVWTFTYPAASGTTDVGDLWIGPQKVVVTGRVLDASNSEGVPNATVSFAGRTATTNGSGTFRLIDVAYSNTSQAAFFGIRGSVTATGFFSTNFSAQPNVAVSGTVTVNDILLTSSSATTPPPPPFNLWGKITPAGNATGTVVTLKQGSTAVRIYNVAGDGQFVFWVPPGTYTIEAAKGTLTGSATATLNSANEVVRKDVTLN